MKTMKVIFSIVLCTITLLSCGREIPSDFDYGTIENNTYTNNFFGLTMQIPDGWFVQDEETQKQLTQEGLAEIDNDKLREAVKAAEITSADLLMASQFDIATHTDRTTLNSNFTIVAENLGVAAVTVNDGNAYLEASKKQFSVNNFPIEINGDTKSMDIDGKTFHYFDGISTMQGQKSINGTWPL